MRRYDDTKTQKNFMYYAESKHNTNKYGDVEVIEGELYKYVTVKALETGEIITLTPEDDDFDNVRAYPGLHKCFPVSYFEGKRFKK